MAEQRGVIRLVVQPFLQSNLIGNAPKRLLVVCLGGGVRQPVEITGTGSVKFTKRRDIQRGKVPVPVIFTGC